MIEELKRRDREIHAFVEFARAEFANENPSKGGQFQAKNAESALQDWTFAIKSNIAVAGYAHTAGIGGFRERIAATDAFCVARLVEAGAKIVGVVNMEEAALGAVTDNPHFGKTHNPLRIGFTPGGSSGGSAAAVAAGLVRASLGTDTMGSCRIPAAYCGVVGFKPSYGRISTAGVEPLSRRLDHVGILARTVADVEAVFDSVAMFDPANADARAYVDDARHLKSERPPVLVVLDAASREGLDADVRRAYEDAIAALSSAGFTLLPQSLDQRHLAAARRAGLLICEAELAASLAPLVAQNDGGISPFLRKMIAFGAAKSASALAAAHAAIDDTELVLRQQLHSADAICWPTAPQTAFAFDTPVPANQADFTCLGNFTGAPAISLPLPFRQNELPSGLQLLAPRGADTMLLALAARIALVVNS